MDRKLLKFESYSRFSYLVKIDFEFGQIFEYLLINRIDK